MARQRKGKHSFDSSRDHVDRTKFPRRRVKESSFKPILVLAAVFGLSLFLFGAYKLWNYKLSTRLFTPLDAPLIINKSEMEMSRFWGTYRSNLYFGLRTRSPKSLMTGLMWFPQLSPDGQVTIRHTCEQSDGLPKYGWLKHDGTNFGSQQIVDKDFELNTDFVKRLGGDHGGDWTARISGKRTGNPRQMVSLLFYVTYEGEAQLQPVVHKNTLTALRGYTPELGSFKLYFPRPSKVLLSSFLITHTPHVHSVKEIVMQNMRGEKMKDGKNMQLLALAGHVAKRDQNGRELPVNLFVQQWILELPFDVEFVFESESSSTREKSLIGAAFTNLRDKYSAEFDKKFEEKFSLKAKGFNDDEVKFAQAGLSNMIGGIGYFYGSSKVISRFFKEPKDYWESALYTAVPSRPFFPRGFLWDEGFHQLLISQWDSDISKDIIGHWLDLINIEGWIPREQILGDEARTKVPSDFVVQHNENANPPTLILPIKSMVDKGVLDEEYLRKIFPRLKAWFNWFNTTQLGNQPSTYRWHGRDAKTDRELNPKTLTSGLDDYPRASHPSDDERHVDLRCWMAFAAGLMADIAEAVGEKSDAGLYKSTSQYLSDNRLLDEYHWSSKAETYSDFGNHTKFVKLVQRVMYPNQPGSPKKTVRVVTSKQGPSLRYVNAVGYVSLFPFLLQILDPTSPKLEKVLTQLRDPEKLWGKYGIRSLSKSDPVYKKHNTEHDAPYWRGAIWININFLAVRALNHYASIPGPYQGTAKAIYTDLRQNLIKNMFREYERSGFIWEQYDDGTGHGKGSHPFTGWSSLVVLMMSEHF